LPIFGFVSSLVSQANFTYAAFIAFVPELKLKRSSDRRHLLLGQSGERRQCQAACWAKKAELLEMRPMRPRLPPGEPVRHLGACV
jgi:hypothetical protein